VLDILTSFLSTYGYLLVFGLILLESAGLPLPGETMLVIASASAANGNLSIVGVVISAALGAIIGDMGGYWFGRTGGSYILKIVMGNSYDKHLIKGQAFFNRYGAASVFLARFVPVVRIISANFAGITAMQFQVFSLYNAAGGLAWATVMGSIGYFFGKNLPLLESIMKRLGMGVIISIGILFLAIWVTRILIHNETQSIAILERILAQIKNRINQIWLTNRFNINQQRLLYFVTGLLLILFFGWVFGSLAEDVSRKDSLTNYDVVIGSWFLAHATEDSSEFFFGITQLASLWVIGLGSLTLSAWLIIRKNWTEFFTTLTSIGGGILLNLLLKNIFLRQRPDFPNAFYHESGYSFPSGHAMMSVLFYGIMSYLVIKIIKGWKWKVSMTIGALTLILLIGLSRIALGVHYLTDVLGGWSAGLTWLITCILLFETSLYPQTQSKSSLF